MRILQVIPSISNVHGGPSYAIRLIERSLRARSVEIVTATTNDDGPGRYFDKQLGVPLQEDGTVRFYFEKQTDFYKISLNFKHWLKLNICQYDLIYIHALFSYVSVTAANMAYKIGVPYVIRPLGTLNQYGIEQHKPFVKNLSLKFVEGPILKNAEAVHFTSLSEKNEAERTGIKMRGVVIPLAVPESKEKCEQLFHKKYSGCNDKTILLFLSRLHEKKNIESLIQAYSQTKLNNTILVIAGSGSHDYVNKLKNLATLVGLHDRIIWLGHIEGEMKHAVLQAADVFVLPSFSENFGIAAAEALMAGVPCILGEGVAIAEKIEEYHAGVVTKPDVESISIALGRILNDKDQLAVMSRNAKKLAQDQFSSEKMGHSLYKLFSSIISESGNND